MATEDKTLEDEVKNPAALLAKNKELLKELSDSKAALQAYQDNLEKAQSDQKAMRDRWYQIAVLEPLETDLRSASAALPPTRPMHAGPAPGGRRCLTL